MNFYPPTAWTNFELNNTDKSRGVWIDGVSEDGLYRIPLAHIVKGTGWQERAAVFSIANKLFERLHKLNPTDPLFEQYEEALKQLKNLE